MSKAGAVRLLLVALVALASSGCSSGHAAAASPPPPQVEVAEVRQQDVPIYGEWVGTLDGFVNTDVRAQVSGYLLKRNYKEGAWVKKGQLLFEIDPRPFDAAVAQAQGQVDQARGGLSQAQSQLTQAQAVLAQANSQLRATQATRQQADAQLLQAKAGLAQAQANQHKTQMDVDRYRPLLDKKAVTQQDYDNAVQADLAARASVQAAEAQIASAKGAVALAVAQIGTSQASIQSASAQVGTAQAAIRSADAQIESASALLQTAKLNLGFTRIISPLDGIAGIATAQVGNLVSPNAALSTVSQVDPIKANFTIPEQEYIDAARRGNTKSVAFELVQADGTIYPHHGRFYAQDRHVSQDTGAILVTATFPNHKGVLRPGQYARVRAIRYTEKHAILIPQRAVSELQDFNQVAVVGTDNKVSMRTIKVGPKVGADWIVRDGLQAGERVIAEGTLKITPGASVNPHPYEGGGKK